VLFCAVEFSVGEGRRDRKFGFFNVKLCFLGPWDVNLVLRGLFTVKLFLCVCDLPPFFFSSNCMQF
jgi:hypothetical protein